MIFLQKYTFLTVKQEKRGILEYPKQRHTEGVELTDEDRTMIPKWLAEVSKIIENETCPKVINKPVCKNCSYYEFCYADE